MLWIDSQLSCNPWKTDNTLEVFFSTFPRHSTVLTLWHCLTVKLTFLITRLNALWTVLQITHSHSWLAESWRHSWRAFTLSVTAVSGESTCEPGGTAQWRRLTSAREHHCEPTSRGGGKDQFLAIPSRIPESTTRRLRRTIHWLSGQARLGD